MLTITFLAIKSFLRVLAKGLVTWYRLGRSNLGKGARIDFPVTVRGNGRIRIGDKFLLQKRAYLNCEGELTIGNRGIIGPEAMIIIEKNGSLAIGNHFTMEKHCIIRTSKKWTIGDSVYISNGTSVFSRERGTEGEFFVGQGSHIANGCVIDISGNLSIGNNVALGSNCTIYTHNHKYDDNSAVAAWKAGIIIKDVVIDDGAWIGSNVTILPGVRIGRRSVIAAGSVVTKDVEPESLYGGNPARLIKKINY